MDNTDKFPLFPETNLFDLGVWMALQSPNEHYQKCKPSDNATAENQPPTHKATNETNQDKPHEWQKPTLHPKHQQEVVQTIFLPNNLAVVGWMLIWKTYQLPQHLIWMMTKVQNLIKKSRGWLDYDVDEKN